MDLLVLLASAMVSFVAVCLFLPWLIKSLRGTTLVGKDLNKPHSPLVPEMGGIAVILGFYAGVAVLVGLTAPVATNAVFFAALSACLGAGIVGLMDDMFRLRKRSKAILPFVLALPLGAVVYASKNTVLLGVDIGILMAVAVPVGVTSASNAANMLEGFNGLGAGLGIIITASLIALSFLTNAQEGLFLLFPLPMILEFILKLRGRFQGENYGKIGPDGRLIWNGRIESLAHAIMKWRPLREWEIVGILWAVELTIAVALVLTVGLKLG